MGIGGLERDTQGRKSIGGFKQLYFVQQISNRGERDGQLYT